MAGNLLELQEEIKAGADAATDLLARKVAARLHILHAKQLGGKSHCGCRFCTALREYVGLKIARGRQVRHWHRWGHSMTVTCAQVAIARQTMQVAEHMAIQSA